MNDYIDRLIGRSLNKAQMIQPRLPAMFEPQTNDEPVLDKRNVDIEPSYHSSKEDVLVAPMSQPDKQMSSTDPVIKNIKTGKNDLRSHTSDRSGSSIVKGLTVPDRSELEYPATSLPSLPSLNSVNAKTEYPDDFTDRIDNENVAQEISLEPGKKSAEDPDPIRPIDLTGLTIGTGGRPESASKKVAIEEPEDQTPDEIKISHQFTQPYSSNNEITIQQQNEKETKSRLDNRADGGLNSRLTGSSNIEYINQLLGSSQKPSDLKNVAHDPHGPESAFEPFKGKLVTGPGIGLNGRTPVIKNDNLEQQESVIRVNIGRIEVRAVTPPASPPQHRSKQLRPVLSLDDYLSQRNGGS